MNGKSNVTLSCVAFHWENSLNFIFEIYILHCTFERMNEWVNEWMAVRIVGRLWQRNQMKWNRHRCGSFRSRISTHSEMSHCTFCARTDNLLIFLILFFLFHTHTERHSATLPTSAFIHRLLFNKYAFNYRKLISDSFAFHMQQMVVQPKIRCSIQIHNGNCVTRWRLHEPEKSQTCARAMMSHMPIQCTSAAQTNKKKKIKQETDMQTNMTEDRKVTLCD